MSSSSPTKYQYEPLPGDGGKHIRIVKIHPGGFSDEIRVSLRVEEFRGAENRRAEEASNTNPEKVPSYEALSYCWGPPRDAGRILVRDDVSTGSSGSNLSSWSETSDGKGWHQWLPARANLLSALRHLRHGSHVRNMWIDAICIDQDNVVQKGPQVAMMGILYARAASVVVWLGPAADESDRAMGLVQSWGSQVSYSVETGHLQPCGGFQVTGVPRDETMADQSVPLNCSDEDSLAVYHLFCRDWFDRLWIRQEVILANAKTARVQCGAHVVPWEVFRNAWGALHAKLTPDRGEFRTKLVLRMNHLGGLLLQRRYIHFSWIRFLFANSQCFDPRDRIYAICSMLEYKGIREAIRPDYTKSTVEVYQDAIIAHLRHNPDSDVQVLRECRLHPDWNGPSWVPDWSYFDQTIVPLDSKQKLGSLLPMPKAWEIIKPGMLRVYGVVLTRLTDIHWSPSLEDVQKLLRYEQRPMDGPYPAGGTVIDAYTRTLLNDRFSDNDLTAGAKRKLSFQTVRDELLQLREGSLETIKSEVQVWLRRTLSGRAFLRTESGLVGLGDGDGCLQPGDEVCCIFGCSRLLVLRSSQNAEGIQRRLVSCCEVDGESGGEGILGPLPSNMRFVIARDDSGTSENADWIGWSFQNTLTGEVIHDYPRLASLGTDMTGYQRFTWLKVRLEVLKECLAARGVRLETLDLV